MIPDYTSYREDTATRLDLGAVPRASITATHLSTAPMIMPGAQPLADQFIEMYDSVLATDNNKEP